MFKLNNRGESFLGFNPVTAGDFTCTTSQTLIYNKRF